MVNDCLFQRARSADQKAERRAAIMAAAAHAFMHQRFDALSLASIAKDVGISKAALYRYFPSKEMLFLSLYLEELERLVDVRVDSALPLWQSTTQWLVEAPLFCRLSAILNGVLEHNLTEQQAKTFKQALLTLFGQLAVRLSEAYGLSVAQATRYLLQVQNALIGCWLTCHPAEVVATVLLDPPFDVFRIDFATALGEHLKALESLL